MSEPRTSRNSRRARGLFEFHRLACARATFTMWRSQERARIIRQASERLEQMRLPDKTLVETFHLPKRERIERKESLNDSDRICQAIRAFAKELSLRSQSSSSSQSRAACIASSVVR